MILLPNFHLYSNLPTVVSKSDLVLATAGSKGIVKLWTADSSKISCLFEQSKETAFGQKRGGYTGLSLCSSKHKSNDDDLGEKVLAIDAEHNMSFLNLVVNSKDSSLLGPERTIVGHNDEILDLCLIPDQLGDGNKEALQCNHVAVATNSAQIRLFNLASYSCSLLDGHTETVLCLDVSPCGRFLASSGKDKTARLWHLESNRCIAVAEGHTEAIGASALSRRRGKYDVSGKAASNGAGSFLLTASKDKTLKKWNLLGANELITYAREGSSSTVSKLSASCSVRAHEKVSHFSILKMKSTFAKNNAHERYL